MQRARHLPARHVRSVHAPRTAWCRFDRSAHEDRGDRSSSEGPHHRCGRPQARFGAGGRCRRAAGLGHPARDLGRRAEARRPRPHTVPAGDVARPHPARREDGGDEGGRVGARLSTGASPRRPRHSAPSPSAQAFRWGRSPTSVHPAGRGRFEAMGTRGPDFALAAIIRRRNGPRRMSHPGSRLRTSPTSRKPKCQRFVRPDRRKARRRSGTHDEPRPGNARRGGERTAAAALTTVLS